MATIKTIVRLSIEANRNKLGDDTPAFLAGVCYPDLYKSIGNTRLSHFECGAVVIPPVLTEIQKGHFDLKVIEEPNKKLELKPKVNLINAIKQLKLLAENNSNLIDITFLRGYLCHLIIQSEWESFLDKTMPEHDINWETGERTLFLTKSSKTEEESSVNSRLFKIYPSMDNYLEKMYYPLDWSICLKNLEEFFPADMVDVVRKYFENPTSNIELTDNEFFDTIQYENFLLTTVISLTAVNNLF